MVMVLVLSVINIAGDDGEDVDGVDHDDGGMLN